MFATASQPSRPGGVVAIRILRENPASTCFHAAAIAAAPSGSLRSTKVSETSLFGSSRTSAPLRSVKDQPFGAVNVAPAGVVIGVSASSLRVEVSVSAPGLGAGAAAGGATDEGGGGGACTGVVSAPPQATRRMAIGAKRMVDESMSVDPFPSDRGYLGSAR